MDAARVKLARQAISIARKSLPDLDDETWREDVLPKYDAKPDKTGRYSLTTVPHHRLNDLLEHLYQRGAPRPKRKSAAKFQPDGRPLMRKLWAIWGAMHRAGKIRDPRGLPAWILAQTNVDSLEWVNDEQLAKCVDALIDWARREGAAVTKLGDNENRMIKFPKERKTDDPPSKSRD